MKLVIDIPKNVYCHIGVMPMTTNINRTILDAVKNGIPLPKGHGRLIDVIKLKAKMFGLTKNSNRTYWDGVDAVGDLIDNAPTIIEADKEV